MENSQQTGSVAPQAANSDVERLHHKAQTFGVVGLVTAVLVPLVGIGFGIAAILQSAKARAQSRLAGERPSRQFGAQRTMGVIAIIVGIFMSAAFVLGSFALVSTFGAVISSIGSNSDYSSRIASMDAAKKEFNSNETVEFGPYDLTFHDLQKSYAPTTEEMTVIGLTTKTGYEDEYYTEPDAVYTKFTVSLERNKDRSELYNRIQMDIPSWGSALRQVEMDGYRCVTVATEKQLRKYNSAYYEGSSDPVDINYICTGNTATPKELTLDVTAFKAVSSIVGTEGMPRKDFTYIVTL